jgi:hypothetical protein
MPDRTLICQDCSRKFVFTEGEQEFYKEKAFRTSPNAAPIAVKQKRHSLIVTDADNLIR